jgi:glucosamine-6-phosphate deaminase
MINSIAKEGGQSFGHKELAHPQIPDIRVFPDAQTTAIVAADKIIATVIENPRVAITYATGNTMVPVYQRLAEAVTRGEVDFSRTLAFHLDEYYPCDPTSEYSFVGYLDKLVFRPLRIPLENRFTMDGLATDPDSEAERYNDLLRQHSISLAILGIGPGCHIAFNEPGSSVESRTRLTSLSEGTIVRDHQHREQQTPEHAITQGIADILDSEEVILIGYGFEKSEYFSKMLYGEIGPEVPASFLRTVGDKVTVFMDQAASSSL